MKNMICTICNSEKSEDDFYKRSGEETRYLQCKKCRNKKSTLKQSERKKIIIEYKGGKCLDCNLISTNFNYVIFDLHHRDPSTKITNRTNMTSFGIDKLKLEADKCDLLCSNCHRLRHFNTDISPLPYMQ